MSLWQRLFITLAAMLLMSLLAGHFWRGIFGADIPGYLSGVVGGVAAVLTWELLKWVGPRPQI